MTRILWVFGWIGVAIWSLVCALAYGLFDLVGRGFMRNADSFSSSPETVEGIFKVFSFLHSFSTGAVVFVWATVSLLILAVPWAIDRILGPARRTGMPNPPVPPGWRGEPMRDPRGVIDLEPGQYSVTPRPGEAGRAVPPPR